MKRLLTGAMIACLLVFASGCSTTREPVTRTEVKRISPPESLYPECREPEVTIETNGDLARGFRAMRTALTQCRSGMEQVKEWGVDDSD